MNRLDIIELILFKNIKILYLKKLMKKIYLVSNDRIWFSNKRFTSNNDLNNIITCLNENYDLNLICRKSNKKLNFLLNKKFNYLSFNQINEKKDKYFSYLNHTI